MHKRAFNRFRNILQVQKSTNLQYFLVVTFENHDSS